MAEEAAASSAASGRAQVRAMTSLSAAAPVMEQDERADEPISGQILPDDEWVLHDQLARFRDDKRVILSHKPKEFSSAKTLLVIECSI